MTRWRAALELGWPTALTGSACLGLAGSNWVAVPTGGAVAGIGAAALAAHASRSTVRLALAAVALACAGLWWGGMRLHELDRSMLVSRIGTPASARVIVTGPPTRTRFSIRSTAEVRRFDGARLRERVLLELPPGRAPPQGAVLELRARPVAPRGPETGFDERGWLARRGIQVVLHASGGWRIVGRRGGIGGVGDRLRAEIARALAMGTTGERRALVTGIVLGADEGIDPELRAAFKAAGLYHLLAVSGQNIVLVGLGVIGVAYVAGIARAWAHVLAIAATLAYTLAVGWQPSVVRAAVAGCLASLAWLASRPKDQWHMLAVGAFVLLVWTPRTLLEPGFQLSFVAVAAIFVTVPRLRRLQQGYPLPRPVVDVVGISAACGLATVPVLWLQFGAIPLLTVPANALAEPAMPILLGAGLSAAAVAPVLPSAAVALSWVAGAAGAWIAFSARLVASVPGAQTSSPVIPLALAVAAGAAFGLRLLPAYRRRGATLAAVALAPLAGVGWWALHPPPSWSPPAGLRVSFLDVGQGDGILLEVPQGALLVDAGPREAHVDRALRRKGLRRLAALVVTHAHRDHVGGAPDVLRHIAVGELLDPLQPGAGVEETTMRRTARRLHVPLVPARVGQHFRLGRLFLRILWPDRAGLPDEDPHVHGVVMLASYGAIDVLLTGDSESPVTRSLRLRRIEVLKVAHHGSSDPGLAAELLVLRPRVAVISVGAGNDYGHPRPDLLATLEQQRGLTVYRTDENGDVVLETDGRSLSVRAERRVR